MTKVVNSNLAHGGVFSI